MKRWGKLATAALAGVMTMSMAFASVAMPGDVGGTWNGYDSFDEWFYSEYGTYPPENWKGEQGHTVGYASELWWSGTTAHWDHEGNCRSFEVRLYRDGDKVCTEKTNRTRYNFSDHMTKEGDYYFTVRAIYGSQHSEWSEESDTHYTRGKHHSSGSHSGSGSHSHSSGVVTSGGPGGPAVSVSQWIQAADGTGRWWYRHANGCYTTNNWELIDGSWYFFDASGWMVTGWIHWNGNTYYCLNSGKMVTGDVIIDGQGRHFDESGAMR